MRSSTLLAACAASFLALLATPALAANDPLATGPTDGASDRIIVGSANFPESQVLAEIYEQALAGQGIKVGDRMNIGSREVYLPALRDGSIDLLPEYSGALLNYLDPSSKASAPADVLAALSHALPTGISTLQPSTAQDTTVVAVTRATAEKYHLTFIGDLKPYAPHFVIGGPPEWKIRADGLVGFHKEYGLTFKSYRTLDVCGPLTLSALVNGQIQVACMDSSDPVIKQHDLVTLTDPKHLIPSQNVLPLIATAKKTDKVVQTLNAVSAALTTQDLIDLNQRLADHESIPVVAADWLKAHHIKAATP